MRSKQIQVILVSALGVFLLCLCAGCTVEKNSQSVYLDPHTLLFGGTLDQLKGQITKLGYQAKLQTLEDSKSHWLFASSYPYRGRNMFDVYVFERPKAGGYGGEYTLRSMFVVYNSQQLVVEFKSEEEGISIYHEKHRLVWLGRRDANVP